MGVKSLWDLLSPVGRPVPYVLYDFRGLMACLNVEFMLGSRLLKGKFSQLILVSGSINFKLPCATRMDVLWSTHMFLVSSDVFASYYSMAFAQYLYLMEELLR